MVPRDIRRFSDLRQNAWRNSSRGVAQKAAASSGAMKKTLTPPIWEITEFCIYHRPFRRLFANDPGKALKETSETRSLPAWVF